MTDKKQTEELFDYNFSSGGVNLQPVYDDIINIGAVILTDINTYKKGEEFTAINGQKGRYEYVIRGTGVNYPCGSNQVINLIDTTNMPFKLTATAKQKMLTSSKHVSLLNHSRTSKKRTDSQTDSDSE